MHRYISLLLLTLLTSLAQAQSTSLRQSRIFAGDIAELTITHDSSLPSLYTVDTAPLQPDFEVLDTSTRVTRVQRDNRSLHRMQWSALLLPRRGGLLSIPSLRYGSNQSDALQLTVEPVPAELQAAQNVFVELEAIPQNPYPGQQTRIVTRLYHNLPLQDGVLNEPESAQRQAFRSTRDTHYEVTRGGENFTVLERSVLLTPQDAGEWRIQPARFRGSVAARKAGETRYIHRASNPLRLQVRDLPTGNDVTNWLPARQLEMNLQWEQSNEPFKPGESLGLSLELRATGLPGEVLPADLLSRASEQYRIYADQVKRSTLVEGLPGDEVFIGRVQQRYVIVFEQAGEITLPALELAWWDTGQDRARLARVEANTLTVTAPAFADDHLRERGGDETAGISTSALPLRWLALVLAGFALLGLAWIARRQSSRILAWLGQARRRRESRLRLERACADNNAVAARRALIDWSRAHWQDERISSLRQIATRCGQQPWVEELARLDAALFAAERGTWQGQGLRRLLEQQRRRGAAGKRRRLQALPGPYPRRDIIPRAETSPRPV